MPLLKRLSELKRAADRLRLILAHDSLILLKTSCGSPELIQILRSSPCSNHNILLNFDATLRSCLIKISNVNVNNMQWQQVSFPIKASGLGIRNVNSIASSAFFASVFKTKQIQNCLPSQCPTVFSYHHFDLCLTPCQFIMSTKQKLWDKSVNDELFSILHASQSDDNNRAVYLLLHQHIVVIGY